MDLSSRSGLFAEREGRWLNPVAGFRSARNPSSRESELRHVLNLARAGRFFILETRPGNIVPDVPRG